ncbi:MAG: hypothetical protein N2376_01015 [Clostridia bacterium]|nr:hypothetical protein [Clostridia bacterium]
MPNRILAASGWEQRIRDVMGVDSAYLPDTVLHQPDVITLAEANIINQISGYGALGSDQCVLLETAVVYECARLLCHSMSARLPKREQGPHATHELSVDWDKKKVEFEEERDALLMQLVMPSPLFHFGLSQ